MELDGWMTTAGPRDLCNLWTERVPERHPAGGARRVRATPVRIRPACRRCLAPEGAAIIPGDGERVVAGATHPWDPPRAEEPAAKDVHGEVPGRYGFVGLDTF